MSDKMKKQQEEARQRAIKRQQSATEEKDKPTPTPTSTSTSTPTTTNRRGTRNRKSGAEVAEEASTAKDVPEQKKGRTTRKSGGGTISNYFKKAEVEVKQDNPTVQEVLENAADEYESKPTAIGEQELVATQQPALITGGKMRTYQLEGLEWLKTLWMNGLSGILADEMGLGKTIQAISMIAFLKENNVSGPFLIAAPLSTVSNWVDEFKRWCPKIKTVLYHGSKAEREELRRKHMKMRNQGDMDFPIICTSYEICMNDRKFLGQYQWRYIVVVCSGS